MTSLTARLRSHVAIRSRLRHARERAFDAAARTAGPIAARRSGERPAIRSVDASGELTEVSSYWGEHTVNTLRVWTPRASRRQLERRFDQYPLFREFSGLWGSHEGEVVLDYGCGPGNDVVGLLLHARPAKVIGIDVSAKALAMAADRLALHHVDPAKVDLILAPEAEPNIPLADDSVDYFQSQGVLHHVSDPEEALRELRRVAKPGARGAVMVYNRESVWRNLYVAWVLKVREGISADLALDEAFKRSTDGEDCPIARSYTGSEFVALCENAGFEATYLGGYLSKLELEMIETALDDALADPGLPAEQREFLDALERDARGFPLYGGMHAGIGGSYTLVKTGGA